MTIEEKIEVILQHVDDEHPVPSYLENDVKKGIGKALKEIENKEGTSFE